MNPLRILHLNSMLSGGGTDDQCVKLAAGLRRLGQEVFIAGPQGREYSKVIDNLGVPLLNTGGGRPRFQFIRRVGQFIRQHNIQIVHAHHGRDIWPAILAVRLSGRRPKIVLSRHLAKSYGSAFSRRFILGQCDALIAVSRFVARVLKEGVYEPESPEAERRSRPPLRGDHSKIQVVYGGIDTSRFVPSDASSQRGEWKLEPRHIAFGSIGGYYLPRGKGQREFLQAAARIHQIVPEARFLIIGRGDMAGLLNEDIEKLGLAGKAWLTPYSHNMPVTMNAIDCLVHSQVGTEAFPGVVLEALACGKPVIASALDGIPEAFAVGGHGRLVPPEDVPSLAEALKVQANTPRLSVSEARQLHDRIARDFSLEEASRRMLQLYLSLGVTA